MITADNAPAEQQRSQLLAELRALVPDFRAPAVAAELVANSVPATALYFRNKGAFCRQVSRDIARVSWETVEATEALLLLDLNQEGLYDMMPEALAHTQDSARKSSETDTRRGVELRLQEKAARTFFGPLENEFAHRSLHLALLARDIMGNDNPARTRQFFEHFFGNSADLIDQQVTVLSYILPLCHKIRGNAALMSLAVSKIIGYPATVTYRFAESTHTLAGATPALGDGQLGINTVLNDRFRAISPVYTLSIEGIAPADFPSFSSGGRQARILRFITSYFFPVAAELHTQLHCTDAEKHLTASTAEIPSHLGFNTYL